MNFYKSIDISGEVQIRDSFGNLAARFDRSTYGQRAYQAFCKGFAPGDELYDKDYNRLMIGPIGEMVKEDNKEPAFFKSTCIAGYDVVDGKPVAWTAERVAQANVPTGIEK